MQAEKNISIFLDASRWIAAGAVLVGHVAQFLFKGGRGFDDPQSLLGHVAYALMSLGHYAVMVFFVISGYLVGGVTLNRWMKSGPAFVDYGIARISRIYTVLIPALVIGAGLDMVGLAVFGNSPLYTNGTGIGSLDDVAQRLNPQDFVLNLALLQRMYVETLGSNVPLWSLAYEWWYYIIFAVVAGAMLSKGWVRYGLLACVAVLAYGVPGFMWVWGGIWVMGLLLYFVIHRRPSLQLPPVVGITLFLVAVAFAVYSSNPDYLTITEPFWKTIGRDALVGLAFCLALASSRNLQLSGQRVHQWAASFSYSTYLCHFPPLLLLATALHERGWLPIEATPTWGGFGWLVAISAVLYGWCYLVYWLTERHTGEIRRWLQSLTTSLLAVVRP